MHALVVDGIDDESILAGVSSEDFNTAYLNIIGISSVGAQQHLLRIHHGLFQQHQTKVSSPIYSGPLKDDNKITKPADAGYVASLEKEMLEKTRAANESAREAAKNAAETKAMMDTFVSAIGVGAGGQMQHSVRTKDGRVEVVVTSPGGWTRLRALSKSLR